MSDLDQILGGEPADAPEPAQQEAPQVEADPVAEPPAEEPVAQEEPAKPEEPVMVPLSALQELRQELKQLKQVQHQAAQPKPQPAPDMFEDPEGYRAYVERNVSNGMTRAKLEMSRFMAEREFGAETVEAAYEYFNQHPDQSQALLNHPSPFHAAVDVYNRQRVAQEIGNDPEAYRQKLEAEIRAKVEAELVAKQVRDKAGRFAPSMADTPGTGGGPKTNWAGPARLDDVLGS